MAIAIMVTVVIAIVQEGGTCCKGLIQTYRLGRPKVLDVGCGKGFLLHEMLLLQPELQVKGFDISDMVLTMLLIWSNHTCFYIQLKQPIPLAMANLI